MTADPSPLAAVRARIDEIDAALLRLLDERASMAHKVAAAKAAEAAAGAAPGFGLRPSREVQLLRRLLAFPRGSADAGLVARVWRELISDSLAKQGPYRLSVWGGRSPVRVVEAARARFGFSPPMSLVERPEDALKAAHVQGVVAVLALDPGSGWWGRLLAAPELTVFAAPPDFVAAGPPAALAVAALQSEPSGADRTLWVTDAPSSASSIEEALAERGLAGDLLAEGGGLKLFALAGYVQRDDDRILGAPGRLKGVVGAAPLPLDL
jgi:chorismate mutase